MNIFKHIRLKLGRFIDDPSYYVCKYFIKFINPNFIPDILFIRYKYHIVFGERLRLNNPVSFNEKLQWLKLYDRRPQYTLMADKYRCKQYVSNLIGPDCIIPTLSVYNNEDEINFDVLPEKFVLKCNHDSGSVVVCRDKNNFDIDKAKRDLKNALKSDYYNTQREWPYKNIKRCIIAEKYLDDNSNLGLTDYKFYCFSGEPKFLYVSKGLENHDTARISYLTLDWNFAPFSRPDYKEFEEIPSQPLHYKKMIEYARILSKDTIFLRVDFYEVDGRLYFSELTFFPGAGLTLFKPNEWDEKIGNLLVLPNK